MKILNTLIVSTFLTCLPALVTAQTYFVENATIVAPDGNKAKGGVLIRDGRLQAIGPKAQRPGNATIIDGDDVYVSPGLFAVRSNIGLVEIGLEASTNDTRSEHGETSVSDSFADGFNPKSPRVDIARIEGVTHAALGGSAARNIFAGTGFVANTSGDFESVENDAAFVAVQLGSNGARLAGGSRSAAMSQLQAALDDASAYPGRYDGPHDGDTLPRRDAAALVSAANGSMPIIIAADRASDLLKVIELKKRYGLDVIVSGAAEGWMVADALADAGIKVIIDPLDNLPGSFDKVAARLDNVVWLEDAGVEYAFTSGYTNLLAQHAGNAVTNGLSWDKAFKAISETPARWFGLDYTLNIGEAATLVVWDGDPLEVTSSPKLIFIDGQEQSLESRQTALRDRYNPTRNETKPYKYR